MTIDSVRRLEDHVTSDFQHRFDEHDMTVILIPTLNEESTIEKVIEGYKSLGFHNIIVVDGHSTDDTRSIARSLGAKVWTQNGKGKGKAVIDAFELIVGQKSLTKYVVMVDGDDTYECEDIFRLLLPLSTGNFDHVIGNRLAHPDERAFTKLNKFGNKCLNYGFKLMHRHDLKDMLSGYRAFTIQSIENLKLTMEGFEIETDISAQCIYRRMKVSIVPVSYHPRANDAKTKLRPLRDGIKIGAAIFNTGHYTNPLAYYLAFAVFPFTLASIMGICAKFGYLTWNGSSYGFEAVVVLLYVWSVLLLNVGMYFHTKLIKGDHL